MFITWLTSAEALKPVLLKGLWSFTSHSKGPFNSWESAPKIHCGRFLRTSELHFPDFTAEAAEDASPSNGKGVLPCWAWYGANPGGFPVVPRPTLACIPQRETCPMGWLEAEERSAPLVNLHTFILSGNELPGPGAAFGDWKEPLCGCVCQWVLLVRRRQRPRGRCFRSHCSSVIFCQDWPQRLH